jgi:hypothetical protein
MPMLRMMKVPARAEAIGHLPRSASSKAGRYAVKTISEPQLLISTPDKLQAVAARMDQAEYSLHQANGPSTPGAGGRQTGTASTGVPGEELPAVHDMLSQGCGPKPSRLHDCSNRRDHRRCLPLLAASRSLVCRRNYPLELNRATPVVGAVGTGAVRAGGTVLLQVGTALVVPTDGQEYDPTDGAVTVPTGGMDCP